MCLAHPAKQGICDEPRGSSKIVMIVVKKEKLASA